MGVCFLFYLFSLLQVPFFSDDEETAGTPKADALFLPRENPRALVIRPAEQWPLKSSADKASAFKDTSPIHENGKFLSLRLSHMLVEIKKFVCYRIRVFLVIWNYNRSLHLSLSYLVPFIISAFFLLVSCFEKEKKNPQY